MNHELKTLPKSQVELTISVLPEEYRKHLETAADRLSTRTAVKGFRPGKVPYDVMKKEVGEVNILNEALERIIQESFYQAVAAEKLDTVGMPKIEIIKLAPGNNVEYKATVALIPVVKLADLSKIKVEKKSKPVTDEQIKEVIENLRKMQAKEVAKEGIATEADIVLVDMDMTLDNVPVEGGQAKSYKVYLSEDHYIPGFNKELIGAKKGEEKKFPISFPTTHYQKHLAGKKVEATVKVKDVLERQLPELDEEFCRKLGQESLEKLNDLLRTNLTNEANRKADEQAEIQMLDKIIAGSVFNEIPDVLIDAERKKMYYELTRDLEKHGVSVEQYLDDIKKTQEEMFKDFSEQAEKRAKAALVSRQVAIDEKIEVEEKEIDGEIALMESMYKDDNEYLENIKKPEVRDTIRGVVRNRKVIQTLWKKVIGEDKSITN
ncbi:MAG: trigger factor [Patescibacteria group bacterium]